jgi:hypothetical protein
MKTYGAVETRVFLISELEKKTALPPRVGVDVVANKFLSLPRIELQPGASHTAECKSRVTTLTANYMLWCECIFYYKSKK